MIDERNFDVLGELQAALRIEPSPDFAARVRARVAGQPIGARWWLADWKLMLAGATIAIGLVAGAAWLARTTPQSASQPSSVAPRSSEPQPAAVVAVPTVGALGRRALTRGRRVTRTSVGSNEPEVLVPPDQGLAVRRLLQILRDKRLALAAAPPSLSAIETAGDEPSVTIPEIPEIPLIIIEPLPGPAGGDRERNPS